MTTPRLVPLHSPLVGPPAWAAVAAALRRRGHVVETPAWPRLSTIGDRFYDTLSEGLAAQLLDKAGPLILAAHSGAGGLVGAAAAALPAVEGVILVDAIMPHPGRSWFDTAPA